MRRTSSLALLLGCAASPACAQSGGGGTTHAATPSYADQPVVIEHLYQTAQYNADGTGRETIDIRWRIQSPAALEALGQLRFPYMSAYQTLSVDSVRVFKAGAPSVLAPPSAVQDVNSPLAAEAPMYSDTRQKIVTVPSLGVGDTLQYWVTTVTTTPVAPGFLWYAAAAQRKLILLDRRVRVDVPAGLAIAVRTHDLAEPVVSDSGGRRIYRWHGTNLTVDTASAGRHPWLEPEDLAVQISSFGSWSDVGRWYAGLERDRETPDARIRAAADSLVRGKTSFADSVAALYDFVSRNFRYVSLSFGVGRYQPHAAAEVFANRYADCKDKHALLAALLRAVGIRSAPALVSTTDVIDTMVPGPYHFDHVITVVPAAHDTLWLDATPGVGPFGYLVPEVRGKPALVIPLDGPARILRAPGRLPYASVDSLVVTAQLADPGHVMASVSRSLRGDAEVAMRAAFQQIPPEQYQAAARAVAASMQVQGTASALGRSDPAATGGPFEIHFTLDDADAVSWSGTHGRLHLPLPRPYGDVDSARTDSIVIEDDPVVERLTLQLPAGMSVEPPAPISVIRDFAEYHSSYAGDGRSLTVARSLRWLKHLPRSRWREVRAFYHTIEADREQEPLLLRTGPAPAAPAADAAAFYQAGVDAYEARNYLAALRSLRRAVAADSLAREAWNELGRTWLALNKPDSAEVAFRRQVAVVPDHQYAWNNLGLALWREKRLDAAAEAFRRQIAITPLDQYAHANLGKVLHEQNKDAAAVPELRQAAAITPDDGALLIVLGRSQLAAGQPDDALATFQRAVTLDASPTSLNSAAYILAEAGVHLDRAETWVRAAIDSVEAPLVGVTLDALGVEQYRAGAILPSYWDTLGWILFRKGDVAGAERYIRAAWLLAFHHDMGLHLAAIDSVLGRRAEAAQLKTLVKDALSDTIITTTYSPYDQFTPPPPTGRRGTAAENAARLRLLDLKTVRLGPSRATVDTRATMLVGPGPRVEELRIEGQPTAMTASLERMIRAARLPQIFPDSAPIRLPRTATITCTGTSCMMVFSDGFVSRTVRVSP